MIVIKKPRKPEKPLPSWRRGHRTSKMLRTMGASPCCAGLRGSIAIVWRKPSVDVPVTTAGERGGSWIGRGPVLQRPG